MLCLQLEYISIAGFMFVLMLLFTMVVEACKAGLPAIGDGEFSIVGFTGLCASLAAPSHTHEARLALSWPCTYVGLEARTKGASHPGCAYPCQAFASKSAVHIKNVNAKPCTLNMNPIWCFHQQE